MAHEQEGSGSRGAFSRREFLGRAAKVGGGLAVLPLLSLPPLAVAGKLSGGMSAVQPLSLTQKLGVLLPQSGAADAASAYLAGINLYLTQSGQQKLKVVTASFGPGNIAARAQQLHSAERPNIMVGLAGA